MEKEYDKGIKNQQGSATVEAVIGFTAFLFAIFTILGLVNFCRAQMLVSSAVDTAAKEMAQYSYFYQMSGLQKFEEALDENGNIGKENINAVIGTVDSFYGSINGAVADTVQGKTEIENMLNSGSFDMESLDTTLMGISNSVEGVKQSATSVKEAFTQVGNDPMLYMRSIVALAGSEGMEAAKRLVAANLARAFVSKHFGENSTEANEKLESLGIEGGLDSMNFDLSNIFADKERQNIEINVIYKVKLFQVFDWVVLEANVSKVASCRGWLGGDNVLKEVVKTPAQTPGGSGEGDANETTGDDGASSEDVVSEETSSEEDKLGSTSTGNWALQHDPTGYNGSERVTTFAKQFYDDYWLDMHTGNFSYHDSEAPTIAYSFSVHATWTYSEYDTIGGNTVDWGTKMLESAHKAGIDMIANKNVEDYSGDKQEFTGITHVVYIPENMPDDQYNALMEDVEKAKADLKIVAKENGLPDEFGINFLVIRDGGTYDYSSSESDYVNIGG